MISRLIQKLKSKMQNCPNLDPADNSKFKTDIKKIAYTYALELIKTKDFKNAKARPQANILN